MLCCVEGKKMWSNFLDTAVYAGDKGIPEQTVEIGMKKSCGANPSMMFRIVSGDYSVLIKFP